MRPMEQHGIREECCEGGGASGAANCRIEGEKRWLGMFGEAMEVKVGIALASGHFAIPGVFGAPWHRFCPSGVGCFSDSS